MSCGELDFAAEAEPRAFALRDYQIACKEAVREGWAQHKRQLVDMATGCGKTSIFSSVVKDEVDAGGRALVIANRENLVSQGARRIEAETGADVDIEMAGAHASLSAPIVMASVQTLQSDARLLGFPANHFTLVVGDESQHVLARSWQKSLNYFHFGEKSLEENWKLPMPGEPFDFHARVLGVTATPDLGPKKSLADWFQSVAFRYSYLQAVNDGWLVPPHAVNVPLEIDIRGLRNGRTANGSDFTDADLSERIIPVIEGLARQLQKFASDRKTIAFLPSIECSRLLAAAVTRLGMNGIFVSGACPDVQEKTEAFRRAGPGTVLANSALYVEGSDFPDVSCVAPFRATESTGYYRQQVGRGTRVLPGIVDGLPTPELRRAAIAMSAKPNLLILDPLWLTDRHTLCNHYDLVTSVPEIKAAMSKMPELSLLEAEERAQRDFIKAMQKEAEKHSKKEARFVNPLLLGVSVDDAALASWEPATAWDSLSPTKEQMDFIRENKVNTAGITHRGKANVIIGKIVERVKMGLCGPGQIQLLIQFGFTPEKAALTSKAQAGAIIGRKFAR